MKKEREPLELVDFVLEAHRRMAAGQQLTPEQADIITRTNFVSEEDFTTYLEEAKSEQEAQLLTNDWTPSESPPWWHRIAHASIEIFDKLEKWMLVVGTVSLAFIIWWLIH